MEETGVIATIGLAEEPAEALINPASPLSSDLLQLVLALDAAIFADAQENDPVDGHLHGVIQFMDICRSGLRRARLCASRSRQCSISSRKASSTSVVPCLPLRPSAYWSKEPLRTASREKMAAISSHLVKVILVIQQHDPPGGGAVAFIGFAAAFINGEFLEVGQDAERELGGPGITAQLESRVKWHIRY